jgi:hypothetical protein
MQTTGVYTAEITVGPSELSTDISVWIFRQSMNIEV